MLVVILVCRDTYMNLTKHKSCRGKIELQINTSLTIKSFIEKYLTYTSNKQNYTLNTSQNA